MASIAIITARGGSKRIPKKNIKNFLGKPIICYSIEAALKSECFDEVMVSTDSDEIAEIARKSGASVPFLRSDKTSNDFSTTADVLEEVIHEYEMRGKNYDSFACIYPTAPFITAGRLKDAFKKFSMSEAYSLMTVVRFSFPPQRALVIRDNLITYMNGCRHDLLARELHSEIIVVTVDTAYHFHTHTLKLFQQFFLIHHRPPHQCSSSVRG